MQTFPVTMEYILLYMPLPPTQNGASAAGSRIQRPVDLGLAGDLSFGRIFRREPLGKQGAVLSIQQRQQHHQYQRNDIDRFSELARNNIALA